MQNPNLGQGPGQAPYYGPEQKYIEEDTSSGGGKGLKPYQARRILFGGIAFLVIALIVVTSILISSGDDGTHDSLELEFWTTMENEDAYRDIIHSFREENMGVVINIEVKDPETYRQELTEAFAEDRGPDIYAVHNTWLPREEVRLEPINEFLDPDESLGHIIRDYPDVFRFDFVREDEFGQPSVYALPLSIDTLALYYNEDYFNAANIPRSPETWEELVENSADLRRIEGHRVDVAGIAMGAGRNIDTSTDILSLLMLQSGAQMNNVHGNRATFDSILRQAGERFNPGEEAMRFYTSFARTESGNYTWNLDMPNSTSAFVQGDAAMMIDYSHRWAEIEERNENLNFSVGPIPQPEDRSDRITYASYWALGVSQKSEHKQLSWEFVRHAANINNVISYLEHTHRPPALRDLTNHFDGEGARREVFAGQILSARSWVQPNNVEVDMVFNNAIDSVILGDSDEDEAVREANRGVNELFVEIFGL